MGYFFFKWTFVVTAFLFIGSCSHTSNTVKTPISSCPSENDIRLAESENKLLISASKLRTIAIQGYADENCSYSVSLKAREVLERIGHFYLSQKYNISLDSFEAEKKKNPTGTFSLILRDQKRTSEFQECLIEEAQFLSDSSLILLWEFYKGGIPPLTQPFNLSLRKAIQGLAEEGHPRAQLWMGFIYGSGLGVSHNLELAEKWWSLSRLPQAKTALGLLYFQVKKDPERAETLLLKALKSDPEATFILGKLYREKKEYSRALAFFEKQVQADPNHSEAHLEIGKMYLNSEGLPRDCRKVREHFHFAADKLHDSKAQYALGASYASKEELNPCFKYSLNQARKYLKSSMEQGNSQARQLYQALFK